MRVDQLAVDVARQVMNANIETKPTFSFGTKRHRLRKEQKSRGGSGQSQTNVLPLPKVATPTATPIITPISKRHQATSQHHPIWMIRALPVVVYILLVALWMTRLKNHQALRPQPSI